MARVTVSYTLSKEGQKAALLSGRSGEKKQCSHVEVELTPALLNEATISDEGETCFTFNAESDEVIDTPEKLNAAIEREKAEAVREREEKIQNILDIPNHSFRFRRSVRMNTEIDGKNLRYDGYELVNDEFRNYLNDPRIQEKMQQIIEFCDARSKEGIEEAVKYRKEEEEREAATAKRNAEEEASKAKKEADRAEWIEKFGSEHLKKIIKAGYAYQGKYVEERAAKEIPGFIIDWKDAMEWNEKVAPSMEALTLEEELESQGHDEVIIVWLKSDGKQRNYDDDDVFHPCEAVVIKNYLGKYDAVKMMA